MSEHPSPSFWALWWHTLDRWSFLSILLLIAMGIWLIMTVSPAVALQHHWSAFVLFKRHLLIVGPGLMLLVLTTFSSQFWIKDAARVMGVLAWMGLWFVLLFGTEIKGAKRWIHCVGFSLQPSEFLKPALAVITADFLSRGYPYAITASVLFLAIFPLFLQPDLGMIFLICLVWFFQCFLAGLPWRWTWGIGLGAMVGLLGVFLCFPHAMHRIQCFFASEGENPFGSHYQILQALKSFASGGILGRGPGGGVFLNHLPDGHADFIFAVAGEELGLLVCLFLLILYGLIIFRGLWHAFQEMDLFHTLAIGGLTLQFAFQTLLNLASVLHLIPTKGVTLPFMSYGGSSFLSLCWSMGMVLALTKRYRELL